MTDNEILQEQIEILQMKNTALANELLDIKNDAIKIFADKLCDKIVSYSLHVDCEGVETLNRLYGMIDSLVKEMTEGNNEFAN